MKIDQKVFMQWTRTMANEIISFTFFTNQKNWVYVDSFYYEQNKDRIKALEKIHNEITSNPITIISWNFGYSYEFLIDNCITNNPEWKFNNNNVEIVFYSSENLYLLEDNLSALTDKKFFFENRKKATFERQDIIFTWKNMSSWNDNQGLVTFKNSINFELKENAVDFVMERESLIATISQLNKFEITIFLSNPKNFSSLIYEGLNDVLFLHMLISSDQPFKEM